MHACAVRLYRYLHLHHTVKLPDYGNGQAGMKRPRYEERPRYEADENQAGTVTFSLISTSFFTAKVCIVRTAFLCGKTWTTLAAKRMQGLGQNYPTSPGLPVETFKQGCLNVSTFVFLILPRR